MLSIKVGQDRLILSEDHSLDGFAHRCRLFDPLTIRFVHPEFWVRASVRKHPFEWERRWNMSLLVLGSAACLWSSAIVLSFAAALRNMEQLGAMVSGLVLLGLRQRRCPFIEAADSGRQMVVVAQRRPRIKLFGIARKLLGLDAALQNSYCTVLI